MPIEVQSKAEICRFDEERFKDIAYAVTGAAYDVHNRFGKFFSENTYKHELASECRSRGMRDVETEVAIRVSFETFAKEYFIDLLVGGGALFELKAAEALSDHHEEQALHYLLLAELQRAKVFNFGAERVQDRFVSTRLTLARRRTFSVDAKRWRPLRDQDRRLREIMLALLADWGGFLSIFRYQEALTHFFGGEESVIRPVAVIREGAPATQQLVHSHAPASAFKVTAFPDRRDTVEDHLRRFLHCTSLHAIQWINTYRHDVTFVSLIDE